VKVSEFIINKMAEYSVDTYSVEDGANDIEEMRALIDIQEAINAAEGAVMASQRTVVNINQADEDEVLDALAVAYGAVDIGQNTVMTLKGEIDEEGIPILKRDPKLEKSVDKLPSESSYVSSLSSPDDNYSR
jgi:hypothetical protein